MLKSLPRCIISQRSLSKRRWSPERRPNAQARRSLFLFSMRKEDSEHRLTNNSSRLYPQTTGLPNRPLLWSKKSPRQQISRLYSTRSVSQKYLIATYLQLGIFVIRFRHGQTLGKTTVFRTQADSAAEAYIVSTDFLATAIVCKRIVWPIEACGESRFDIPSGTTFCQRRNRI